MVLNKLFSSIENGDIENLLKELNTSFTGLTKDEAEERIEKYGLNTISNGTKNSKIIKLLDNIKNPLVLLLLSLSIVSYFTGDIKATIVMFIMVSLGVILKFVQENKADKSTEKLKSLVSTTATVIRDGTSKEIELKYIVPGDIIHLSSGDMIPADIRLLTSKDLFVNQSSLTGESIPIEKNIKNGIWSSDFENPNLCFMGTNVESGTALALVISTGLNTHFGKLTAKVSSERPMTSFDKGINDYTMLMIKLILIMAPVVFLINGFTKGDWFNAFLFAIAVAVGLTPEMLPMIVTVNLSKGAVSISKKKVIVKRLNAIQNFGAMNILCTDKTGTITCGKVVLERHLNIYGDSSERVLKYAFLNSYYQTGLRNIMDTAILNHKNDGEDYFNIDKKYKKIDEIPFDFMRKRMSVVIENKRNEHVIICKGAIEEILSLCKNYETKEGSEAFIGQTSENITKMVYDLNAEGFRVLAIAYKIIDNSKKEYTVSDENGLTLLGFLAFLDPPKESSAEAISKFNKYNINVKVLTGDNEIVTRKICEEVHLPIDRILLGNEIDTYTDDELAVIAEKTSVFAKLSPLHKERIIKVLQSRGNVVGFMGDGINDAPALKAADVSISVDTAVDIAKESSDIILLENNLLVLEEGVLEGRRVFGNIVKYIKMTGSSNFGNMFSVLGASIFVPFLPMLPIQVLTNNLLYDFSQISIPSDNVDDEWIAKPRKWAVSEIKNYIFHIGPISSIFDYITYFIMLFVFKAWNNPTLFQTGWFLESLFTQTLIIHVIRTNKIPFIQSKPSKALMITSLLIVTFGVVLVNTSLGAAFQFTKLPLLYYLFLALILLFYIVLTQLVKVWYIKKYNIN